MKQQNIHIDTSGNSSFEKMLSRHKVLIFRICRHYSGREATADDLMQDIAIALWRKREVLAKIPEGAQREAWVWRVARNAAIDTLRRSPGHEAIDEASAVNIREDENALIESLREQIECLDEPDRTIVKMQMEGYSYEEISRKVKLSVGNIGIRLTRVKEKLRIIMN